MNAKRIALLACCWATAGLGHFQVSAGQAQSSKANPAVHKMSIETERTESIEFKVGDMGEIKTKSGICLGFTNFKASDGIGLMVLYLAQHDPVQATQAFNEELAKAVKIVERGVKKDQGGNVVGERAEILLPSKILIPPFHPVPGLPRSAVLWTDGSTFHEILSGSMQDARELEKVY